MLNLFNAYTFKTLQEAATIFSLLRKENIAINDFIAFLKDKNNFSKYRKKNKIGNDYIPRCFICGEKLIIKITELEGFESVLVCKCGYEYYTDISVTDQIEIIKAKRQGKEPDFLPEEIRASSAERKKRRKICKECDQLTLNGTCKACGCRMKHRTYYKILQCPKKKW